MPDNNPVDPAFFCYGWYSMMTPYFTAAATLGQLKSLLGDIVERSKPNGLIILGCVDNPVDDDDADAYFRHLDVPVGGGLFPGVIHAEQVHERGWLVYALHGELSVTCSENLSLNDQSAKVLTSAAPMLTREIVRDPIGCTDQGGLICVGEFDDHCFVYVLTSAMDELLASTAGAARQADADLGCKTEHKIVFDCISRFLLMKEQFNSELAMLGGSEVPSSGVLSIGEIASSSDGFLEFYNKTTAVAAFSGE
jgi:hypothetical protein